MLGTVEPTWLQWRELGNLTSAVLFRVSHSYSGDSPGTGPVQITAIYSGAGRYGWEESWPDGEPRVFTMRPSREMQGAGLVERRLAIRLGSRARKFADSNWRVSIEEWIGPMEPPPELLTEPILAKLDQLEEEVGSLTNASDFSADFLY